LGLNTVRAGVCVENNRSKGVFLRAGYKIDHRGWGRLLTDQMTAPSSVYSACREEYERIGYGREPSKLIDISP
jgi:RimJ/RimL family protein N-acetyltransferase